MGQKQNIRALLTGGQVPHGDEDVAHSTLCPASARTISGIGAASFLKCQLEMLVRTGGAGRPCSGTATSGTLRRVRTPRGVRLDAFADSVHRYVDLGTPTRILVSQRLANQEGVASDAGVQGYKGARWGKETGPQFNREIDSNLRTTCGGGLNLICPSPRLALLARAFICFCAEDHACSACARNRCRTHCH